MNNKKNSENQKLLFKKYNDYLQSNISVIYSNDIDNNIINGFSGFYILK